MPIRQVDLTERSDQFINAGVDSGRFHTASEAVEEALGLLEAGDEEKKLAWLRSAAQESFASMERGEGTRCKSIEDVAAFLDQLAEEAAADVQRDRL